MTNLNHPRIHNARRHRAQLISEAVVASYIHDISQRHSRYPISSRTRGATSSPNPTGSSLGTPTSMVENRSPVAIRASLKQQIFGIGRHDAAHSLHPVGHGAQDLRSLSASLDMVAK